MCAWDVTKPADNSVWNDAAGEIRANFAALVAGEVLGSVYNVKAYGATGLGSADDTAELQAAIDAATTSSVGTGTVFIPAGTYMFSNLKLPPTITILGESMWHSILKRITGSTGNAIQESTTIQNAAKIRLLNFTVNGNSTAGTGIDLGSESTVWGTSGIIDNIIVRDFTGALGGGLHLVGNAAKIGYVLVQNCTTTAVELTGAVFDIEHIDVVATSATTTGFKIASNYCLARHLYCEGDFTNPFDIDGSYGTFENVTASISTGVTITNLIDIDSSDLQNRFLNIRVLLTGTAAVTNIIKDNYNSVTLPRKGFYGKYCQNAESPDYSIKYSDDTAVTIPAWGSIRTVVMDNLTANRAVTLPQISSNKSGYPIITVVNDSDVGNAYRVHVTAQTASEKIGTRSATYPLHAQSSVTLKAIDTDVGAANGWKIIGGTNNSLMTRRVELSNANIIDLADTPIELVPAPGADMLIEFVSAVFILNYSGGAFAEPTDPDDLAIEYDNGGDAQICTFDATNLITATADHIQIVNSEANGVAVKAVEDAAADIVNKNIALVNTGTDYTVGASTSTMTVIVTWREHYSLGL